MKARFSIFFLLIWFSACEEDIESFSLLTEESLYVSSEKAQLVGRLISDNKLEVEDHGFWIGSDESFSDPIVVSLGKRTGPGRFLGEVQDLSPGRNYFTKSYAEFKGEIIFGNIIQLNSKNPGIFSFFPEYELPGKIIEIIGLNLSPETKVFFDNAEAKIEDIIYESLLKVRIPPIENNTSPKIKLISNGNEMVFGKNFEYIIGNFSFVGFPEKFLLNKSLSFTQDGKFYVGSGLISALDIHPFFWEFDPELNRWSTHELDSDPHINGFGINGYYGGGMDYNLVGDTGVPNPAFWKWNENIPIKKADLPYPAVNSIAFQIQSKIYLLGGSVEGFENLLYEYDINRDSWNAPKTFPFKVKNNLTHFVYEDKLYFISDRKELYVFDPDTGEREIIGMFPGDNSKGYGVASIVGDRVIVGFYEQSIEVWELNLKNISWKRKSDFPGIFLGNNLGIFSKNNSIYLLRSTNQPSSEYGNMEFWKFDPDKF